MYMELCLVDSNAMIMCHALAPERLINISLLQILWKRPERTLPKQKIDVFQRLLISLGEPYPNGRNRDQYVPGYKNEVILERTG